MASGKW